MKRRFLAFLTAALLAVTLLAGMAQAAGNSNIAAESRNGVVRVLAAFERTLYLYDGSNFEAYTSGTVRSSGTAFGVGKAGKETDVFVTNRHVVENTELTAALDSDGNPMMVDGRILCYEDKLQNVYLLLDDYAYSKSGLDTSRAVPCSIIYQAKTDEADLAVLRAAEAVPGRVAMPLLAEGHEIESGEEVIALGYPASTDEATRNTDNEVETYAGSIDKVTVTRGSVSTHNVFIDNNDVRVNAILHTAAINHGNSGGPLINTSGAVVGVNTWGLPVDGQQNFYSIEIEYVRDILDDLKISYDVKPAGINLLVIAIAIAAAAVIVLVVVLVLRKRPHTDDDNNDDGKIPPPTQYRIQAESGVFAGRRFAVSGQVRIGVDPAQNDLVYPQTPGISRIHCVVIEQGGLLYIKDLGSSYGTFLAGGQRLASNQAVQVKIGDRFYLGSEKEMFRVTGKGGM